MSGKNAQQLAAWLLALAGIALMVATNDWLSRPLRIDLTPIIIGAIIALAGYLT